MIDWFYVPEHKTTQILTYNQLEALLVKTSLGTVEYEGEFWGQGILSRHHPGEGKEQIRQNIIRGIKPKKI